MALAVYESQSQIPNRPLKNDVYINNAQVLVGLWSSGMRVRPGWREELGFARETRPGTTATTGTRLGTIFVFII